MTTHHTERTGAHVKETAAIEQTRDRIVYTPDTDICENDKDIVVLADMPGVDEKHVDVTLENNVLTITGHAEIPEPAGFDVLHREFVPADYRRAFTLAGDIDRNQIQARMRNGVLRLVLPKSPESQPRKIAVKGDAL